MLPLDYAVLLQCCQGSNHAVLSGLGGLSDGTALAQLLVTVCGEKSVEVEKVKIKDASEAGPGSTAVKLDNLNNCFALMETVGIKTTGVTPKDIMESNAKHMIILMQNIMRWVGNDTGRRIAPTRDASAARNARDKWASQLRSIEETRQMQRRKAQDSRQRMLEAMTRTVGLTHDL